ncbi:MAG TPA: RES family NAD+ phosphorylase [Terriglobales bacterium]
MLPERQLGAALRKIAPVPIRGPFSRAVALHNLFPKPAPAPRRKPQPLWGMGSKRFGGRYTPKNSFETIYVAKDKVTALKEAQALISIPSGPAFTIVTVPWVTVAIQGFLSSVLDLTKAVNVEAIGSSYQELTGAWRWVPGQTGEPPTHLLGRLCHTSRRFDGICYPSSKNPPGVCVAVFPDRLRKPAYLEVYDPHGNVAQRLP